VVGSGNIGKRKEEKMPGEQGKHMLIYQLDEVHLNLSVYEEARSVDLTWKS